MRWLRLLVSIGRGGGYKGRPSLNLQPFRSSARQKAFPHVIRNTSVATRDMEHLWDDQVAEKACVFQEAATTIALDEMSAQHIRFSCRELPRCSQDA